MCSVNHFWLMSLSFRFSFRYKSRSWSRSAIFICKRLQVSHWYQTINYWHTVNCETSRLSVLMDVEKLSTSMLLRCSEFLNVNCELWKHSSICFVCAMSAWPIAARSTGFARSSWPLESERKTFCAVSLIVLFRCVLVAVSTVSLIFWIQLKINILLN